MIPLAIFKHLNVQCLGRTFWPLTCVALQISPWAGAADTCPCWEDAGETQEPQGHDRRADGSSRTRCGRGQTYTSLFTQSIYIELMGYDLNLFGFLFLLFCFFPLTDEEVTDSASREEEKSGKRSWKFFHYLHWRHLAENPWQVTGIIMIVTPVVSVLNSYSECID